MRELNRREWLASLAATTACLSNRTVAPFLETHRRCNEFGAGQRHAAVESGDMVACARPKAVVIDIKRHSPETRLRQIQVSPRAIRPDRPVPWSSTNDRLLVASVLGPLFGISRTNQEGIEPHPRCDFPTSITYECVEHAEWEVASEDQDCTLTIICPKLLSICYESNGAVLSATLDPKLIVLFDPVSSTQLGGIACNQRLGSVCVSEALNSYRLSCASYPEWETIVNISSSADFRGGQRLNAN
jgi:hypothetical protein